MQHEVRGYSGRIGTDSEQTDTGLGAAIVAALRASGERITVPRRMVIDVLAEATEHLSADDVYERLTARSPGVHRATVYRTIEALVRAGVVNHVHLPHGAATYHLVRPGHRAHLHLVCRSCERIVDAPPELLDQVVDEVARSLGFRLDADHVALTGWCADCTPD